MATSSERRPERIHVAYVVHSFLVGGLERCVARLADKLDRKRFRASVICLTTSGGAAKWITRPDVSIHELHKPAGNDRQTVNRMARLLRDERIDVAHSHNWATLLETSLACRKAGTTTHVHAERGMFYHGRNAGVLKRFARRMAGRWALNRAKRIVAVTDSVRDHLVASYGGLRTPIEVIVNGIDAPAHDKRREVARDLRSSIGVGQDSVLVGSLGRLVPVKDFATAIRGLAGAVSSGVDAHLAIVGGGPECETLLRLSQDFGVEARVHLQGERSDIGDWLAAFDVYVNTSLSEGMSQSILEAMAIGLPLIVTDVGANSHLARGIEEGDECGRVIAAGDVEAFSRELVVLSRDRSLREKLAARATERVERDYGTEEMVRRYESLYETVCYCSRRQCAEPEMRPGFPMQSVLASR